MRQSNLLKGSLILGSGLIALLAACTSLLGDFEVTAGGTDAGGDVAQPGDGSTGNDGGGGEAGPTSTVFALAASRNASCAILDVQPADEKIVVCWGAGDALGMLAPPTTATPLQIGGGPDGGAALQLETIASSPSSTHFCGIQRQTQNVVCWGVNENGQTGAPIAGKSEPPHAVMQLSGGPLQAKTVAVGGTHTCAIRIDDQLFCWGNDTGCAVGANFATCDTAPGDFPQPQNVTPQKVEGASKPVKLALGDQFSCVQSVPDSTPNITPNARCWGKNDLLQTGSAVASPAKDPQQLQSDAPVTLSFFQLYAGKDHACALEAVGGNAGCWGSNVAGKVDPVTPSTAATRPVRNFPMPDGGTSAIRTIAVGENFTCFVPVPQSPGAAARALCGGSGGDALPLGRQQVPTMAGAGFPYALVDGIHHVRAIAAGQRHVCAIAQALQGDPAEGVFCWGANNLGQVNPATQGMDIGLPNRVALPAPIAGN